MSTKEGIDNMRKRFLPNGDWIYKGFAKNLLYFYNFNTGEILIPPNRPDRFNIVSTHKLDSTVISNEVDFLNFIEFIRIYFTKELSAMRSFCTAYKQKEEQNILKEISKLEADLKDRKVLLLIANYHPEIQKKVKRKVSNELDTLGVVYKGRKISFREAFKMSTNIQKEKEAGIEEVKVITPEEILKRKFDEADMIVIDDDDDYHKPSTSKKVKLEPKDGGGNKKLNKNSLKKRSTARGKPQSVKNKKTLKSRKCKKGTHCIQVIRSKCLSKKSPHASQKIQKILKQLRSYDIKRIRPSRRRKTKGLGGRSIRL